MLADGRAGGVVKGPQHSDDVAQRDVREIAFRNRPERLALEIEDGPARRLPGAARNLEDLAQVEIAVDPLQGPGAAAFEPDEEPVQRFTVRADGGPGLGPGLPHALGHAGRDVAARNGFGGDAERLGQPAVHRGGGGAKRVGLGGEIPPAARRVDGKPPGIQSAGKELVRHGQFAERGAGRRAPRTGTPTPR